MDIISRFFDWLPKMMARLNPATQSFLLRAVLMLLLGCLLPAMAFHRGDRSQLLQRFLFVAGVFIGGIMPINWLLAWQPKPKGYLLILALAGLIFLPLLIPFFISRTAGAEKKLKMGIAIALLGLFLLNLLSLL